VKVLAAIPTLEAPDLLWPLLDNLLDDPVVGAILLMDNGLPEAARERAAALSPSVKVQEFYGGNSRRSLYGMWNDAWQQARVWQADYLFLCNDDIRILRGTAGKLAEAMDWPNRIREARTRRRDGRYDPADDADLMYWWLVSPDYNRPTHEGYDRNYSAIERVHGTFRHGGIAGWCFMLRADIPVVPIDERFAWWCGDDDLAFKVEAAGGGVGVYRGIPVDHEHETTARNYSWTFEARERDKALAIELWGNDW
jgi:GT2 family glycosyltransferase